MVKVTPPVPPHIGIPENRVENDRVRVEFGGAAPENKATLLVKGHTHSSIEMPGSAGDFIDAITISK